MMRDNTDAASNVVEIHNLCKSYGDRAVLRDVSFNVRRGEIFGFLGANGAGKTTTLEIMEGLRHADSGTVRIFGLDVRRHLAQIRQRLGVSLQASQYWGLLSVRETITLFQSFYQQVLGLDELVHMFDLEACLDRPLRQLSGGNYQRVTLALALVNDPELVLLDEPTTGLDPSARRRLWEVLRSLCERGRSVLLTTHYMDEAQSLCHRIAMINDGRIVQCGTPEQLIEAMPAELAIGFAADAHFELTDLQRQHWCRRAVRTEPGRYLAYCADMQDGLHGLLAWASAARIRVRQIEMRGATLDDVFIEHAAGRMGREE
jgi:ABC-2 type transport system ATP-binding protein